MSRIDSKSITASHTGKRIATFFTVLGVVFTINQWWWIAEKLRLCFEHRSSHFATTVGEDIFPLVHLANSLMFVSGLFSMWAFRRERTAVRSLVRIVLAANFAAWTLFVYMQATGMILGYDEFMQGVKAPR